MGRLCGNAAWGGCGRGNQRNPMKTGVLSDSCSEPNSEDGTNLGYQHRRVHHSAKIYVIGDAHTNSVEGFWSLIKRGVGGVYHAVSRKHLQMYLDEYSFRYNHRHDTEPMFLTFLQQVVKAPSSC
jgi:ISXO2-like transposase domain